MSLQAQIDSDLKDALKGGDKLRAQTLRGLKSAIKYAEIDAQGEFDDDAIQNVIAKQAKQRRDSIAEYEKGGRDDLVQQETAELDILEAYLPEQLSEDEIRAKAEAIIAEMGVSDMKGMGQVMARLMAELQNRADGKLVSKIVRQLLGS